MEQQWTGQSINRARVCLSEQDPYFRCCDRRGIVLIEADEQHEAFAFALKKAAEREAVTRIFGWDEPLQYQLHLREWQACKPSLILFEGKAIGSVLLESVEVIAEESEAVERSLHFSRFFLMPEWQGRGIGSAVLAGVMTLADAEGLPCQLQYLVGNPVAALYCRFGFEEASRDSQFVTMIRQPLSVA